MKAEDREPLAQALFDAGYGVGEQVDIDRLKAKLAALGYEVRPIAERERYEALRRYRFDTEGIEQAAEAARCTCGSLDSVHSPTCARAVAAAVAPLVAKVLAAGDELTAEHGESCNCEICLAVQPLVDAAVDLAAVAHDPTICTGTDAVPCGCVCFDCNERGIHQAAEAADREAAGGEPSGERIVDSDRAIPSAAVAPYEHPHVWEVQEVCEGCGDRRAIAPATSSAEVGGSLDVEALRTALDGLDVYAYDRDLHGEPLEINEATHRIAAAYDDAIRKRDPSAPADPTGGGA